MLQRPNPRLILASASASRRSLMAAAGLVVTVQPADVDEVTARNVARAQNKGAGDTALWLADLKAAAVARQYADALVIGADQILVCADEWFDKPSDIDAARRQLRALRGRSHVLATAAVCWQGDSRVWHHAAMPSLTMRDFSDAFLEGYLAAEGDTVTGSVGAYRLEKLGIQLFSDVNGEHSSILGLPMLPLLAFLRERRVLVI